MQVRLQETRLSVVNKARKADKAEGTAVDGSTRQTRQQDREISI